MVDGKWCNGEIKIRIGHLFSHDYIEYVYLFYFSNTTFSQQTKQYITFNFLSLTTSTATKFMLSNQVITERRGFIRGDPIVVREILTLI